MPKKPTAEDAQIIMRLYDLRREPEMRKTSMACLIGAKGFRNS